MYQLYQSFQCDDSGSYIGVMDMQGRLSEHEEQTGEVRLYTDHHFFDHLDLSEMDPMPMREMWMKDGVESYYDLVPFPGRSRKQSVVMV
jgi:predicted GIY-YIG superfamily endonuclease